MTDDRLDRVRAALGPAAEPRLWRAPGRVNLLGGQVDYHDGLVVGVALDADVVVGCRPRSDGRVTISSDGGPTGATPTDGGPTGAATTGGRVEPHPPTGLAAEVIAELGRRGRPSVGADLVVASTVPVGAGLSSSAAFELALALALCDVAGWTRSPVELAQACQAAEHAFGVPCGIQDQMTSLLARAGHALLLDCATLEVEALALPPGVGVVVVHSGVSRALGDSAWSDRREESLADARALGRRVLRGASASEVADRPRARHVVSEIARVERFADALRRGDVASLGPLMLASHASSRDDMQVSTPELDALVDALVDAGALGARLTGGGFGGCVVALVPEDAAESIAAAACRAYRAATGRVPTPRVVHPAAGAGPVPTAG